MHIMYITASTAVYLVCVITLPWRATVHVYPACTCTLAIWVLQ